jgi:hypothetical protein
VTGADPNKPAKNLVMRIVCMSFAVAVPKEKQPAMKYGMRTAGFLPYLLEVRIFLKEVEGYGKINC